MAARPSARTHHLSLVRGEEIMSYLDCPKLDELLVIYRRKGPPIWDDSISLKGYPVLRKITLSQDGDGLDWAPRLLSPLSQLKELSDTVQNAKDPAGREVPLLKALAKIDPNTGLWLCPSLTHIRFFCTDEPAGFDYPVLRDIVDMRAKGGINISPLELVHVSSLSTLHVSAAAGRKALDSMSESVSFETVPAYPTEEFLESAAVPQEKDMEWPRTEYLPFTDGRRSR